MRKIAPRKILTILACGTLSVMLAMTFTGCGKDTSQQADENQQSSSQMQNQIQKQQVNASDYITDNGFLTFSIWTDLTGEQINEVAKNADGYEVNEHSFVKQTGDSNSGYRFESISCQVFDSMLNVSSPSADMGYFASSSKPMIAYHDIAGDNALMSIKESGLNCDWIANSDVWEDMYAAQSTDINGDKILLVVQCNGSDVMAEIYNAAYFSTDDATVTYIGNITSFDELQSVLETSDGQWHIIE